jgi:putative membrane protein
MPSPDRIRGLPRERTGLAWERSALGFAALAGIALGIAARREAPGLVVLSAVLLAVAGATWRHGRRSYERPAVAAQPRALGLLALATAVAALAAAVAVLVV